MSNTTSRCPDNRAASATLEEPVTSNALSGLAAEEMLNSDLKGSFALLGFHPLPPTAAVMLVTRKLALQSGLRILADLGVGEALITCSVDNAASIKVIEKCGGRRTEDTEFPG